MNGKDLMTGLSFIDQKLIEESELSHPAPEDRPRPLKKGLRRPLLLAAVLLLAAALVGCAVVCASILFGSPKEMIAGLYGENTGYSSAAPMEDYDPEKPDSMGWTVPGFEKQPVEETVAQELQKWVSPVGKRIDAQGLKLTVDAYIYDSATQCGLITMLLEHDTPFSDDQLGLGRDGCLGGIHGSLLNFNQYGWPYLIPEKTTENLLAFTFYFRADLRLGTNLLVSFPDFDSQDRYEEYEKNRPGEIAAIRQRLKQELSPEEAEAKLRVLWGDELVAETFADRMEQVPDAAYNVLASRAYEQNHTDEMICVSLPDSGSLPYRTFGQGSVYVNSLAVRIQTSRYAEPGSDIHTLIFHMTDGTSFVVVDRLTDNTLFKRGIEHGDSLYMLNSAVNIDKIQSIEVAGNTEAYTLEAD